MIVYRQQQQEVKTVAFLRELLYTLDRFRGGTAVEHRDAVRILIDYGQFETALADLLSPRINGMHPTAGLLRRVGHLTGRLFCRSWRSAGDTRVWADRVASGIEQVVALPLPDRLQLRVAEGYAYYSLYPETYIEASRQFLNATRPRHVTCIGIRTIGTSLSAVVAAALEEQACPTESCTVRCQGHPFDRHLLLDAELAEYLARRADGYYAIVDEGPGLSGSTFCCVAAKLAQFGVPDERIVFFPSHDADPSTMVSEAARLRWPRHRRYVADFDVVWVRSGRLAASLPEGELTDISAGQWRPLLFERRSQYPAVQPSHERRKYLLRGAVTWMLKFAGLGRYGEATHARAVELARAGFHPPVHGLHDGFLATEFVKGRPMRVPDVDERFLERVAQYLAHLRRIPGSAEPMSPEEWMQMIEVNVTEGLGSEWADRFRRGGVRPPEGECDGSADGRMLLHEWLRLEEGHVKTDGVDHGADHFSPGCPDPAWDIAACRVEWDLPAPMEARLIGRYTQLAGDATLPVRLPFYTLAYLAHRLGYAKTAARTLGIVTFDGCRFERMAHRYRTRLKKELSRL
jgi:hypothetical protein